MRCAKIKLTDKKDGDKRTVPLSPSCFLIFRRTVGMVRRSIYVFLVLVIVLSFTGCNQMITDFLISIRETKMDHPSKGVYHNDELNVSIDFGADEHCPVLILSDGTNYILRVSRAGRFNCFEYNFNAEFMWEPGDDFVLIKIVKFSGDYIPGKWYILTPIGKIGDGSASSH